MVSDRFEKSCPDCAALGIVRTCPDCVDCSGTGRVPDEVATLRAQLDAARAEVERLKDVASAAHGLVVALRAGPFTNDVAERAVVLALNATGTDYLGDIVRAKNTPERIAELLVERENLTAEVDRLTAREREATEWVRAAEFAAPLGSGAWGACPRCDRSKAQGHAGGCSIAAWLAGCAP